MHWFKNNLHKLIFRQTLKTLWDVKVEERKSEVGKDGKFFNSTQVRVTFSAPHSKRQKQKERKKEKCGIPLSVLKYHSKQEPNERVRELRKVGHKVGRTLISPKVSPTAAFPKWFINSHECIRAYSESCISSFYG